MPKRNQLENEKSPYLLQHQDNPVHWFAWGEEAFAAARAEGKPIFLSIGYSTCHWCHVMAHESFESEEVAQVLNQHFIAIKLDREERPDIDEIYMSAIHAMGQRGGWPLSVFLTPDLKPFFAGTYWPKAHFIQILQHIAGLWREKRSELEFSGEQLLSHLLGMKSQRNGKVALDAAVFQKFFENSSSDFDRVWGGFGHAPKFPHAVQLSMLLRIHRRSGNPEALQMVVHTLEKMAQGGLYDHLGGGFARYSTDARWLIPHFEKMLYDNALLAVAYLEAFQETKIAMFEQVAKQTLDYVLREMTDAEGGFYSAEDADSEGEEGKFYVWSYEELRQQLEPKTFERFAKLYQATPEGNFEGKNHLALQPDAAWSETEFLDIRQARQKLLKIRDARIHPHLDDKILTSWNALMIRAMALGFRVTQDPRYLEAAERAADFLRKNLFRDGELFARYRQGDAAYAGRLEDYAYLVQALLDLYLTDFNPEHLRWALELQACQERLFADAAGAYFFTDGRDSSVLFRSKEGMDGALPNANAVVAENLLRLEALMEERRYGESAASIFEVYSKPLSEYPHAFSQMLLAWDRFDSGSPTLVVASAGDEREFFQKLWQDFSPHWLVLQNQGKQDFPKLLAGKFPQGSETSFYLCQNFHCEAPTLDGDEVFKMLRSWSPQRQR